MTSMGPILKSPIVWGGGAVLGVLILLRSSPANANVSATMDAVNPAVLSANVQMNAAAYGAQIQLAEITAGEARDRFQADIAAQALVYGFLKNADNNNALMANARNESMAGITNSLIQSSTAIIIDQSNNANRLALGQQTVEIAQIQATRDVSLGYYQYKAQKAVSKNNLIGTIVGSVAKVASTALMA